jgi:hypothetical protein
LNGDVARDDRLTGPTGGGGLDQPLRAAQDVWEERQCAQPHTPDQGQKTIAGQVPSRRPARLRGRRPEIAALA